MRKTYHDIFRAIHEGKWLKIEYCNQKEEITKFWIGIRDIDVRGRGLLADGFHYEKAYVRGRISNVYRKDAFD